LITITIHRPVRKSKKKTLKTGKNRKKKKDAIRLFPSALKTISSFYFQGHIVKRKIGAILSENTSCS
jgi:hypothetical protein